MQIFTDGGCHGNPGPGAWAFVALSDLANVEKSGFSANTTNNRMELQAVIEALTWATQTHPNEKLEIHTDSQYVQKGISEWIHSWVRNGWRTAAKQEVKNKDLWQNLLALSSSASVTWKWVRGHSGNTYNERCDELVQAEINNK